MFRMFKFAMPVLALVSIALFAARISRADEPTSKPSSVKITVQDGDGKAVEAAHVRLMAQGAKPKDAPIAEGDTAADGTVQFDNIAAGKYNAQAASKDKTVRGRGMVTVAGDGAVVSKTITIKAGGGGGSSKGGGNFQGGGNVAPGN